LDRPDRVGAGLGQHGAEALRSEEVLRSVICDDLQVIELGAGSIAASLAGMILADNGARVVKLEPPEGDRLREAHPCGFAVWNRGKESVVADLRADEGRQAARRLIVKVDVVIEGFGAGVAERWGLSYEDLVPGNPGLVYCSIKGFGSTGPYARLKAYEGVVAAKAGVYTQGAFGFRPGPIFFSAPLASTGAGHMALQGILAALTARMRTGRGQRLEATMVQGLNPLDYFGTVTWQVMQRRAAEAAKSGAPPSAGGVAANRYSMFLPTKDGRWISTTQMLPHQARALSRACGLEHTFDDPRFAKQPQFASAEDAAAWEDLVWEAMMSQSYDHWERALLAEPDIAFELCRFSEEGLDHAQILHNGEAVAVEGTRHGTVWQVGPVARFSDTPAHVNSIGPELGVHGADLSARAPIAPSGEPPRHPFEGTTIVELGYFFAMPFGLTLAASLGARVIKIEGKGGDPMRTSFGLPETGCSKTMEAKESISLDLQTAEGRKVAQQLVASADVFVNGFRTGVAERMGLGYETLKELNPRLVYVHATGYGTDGPYAARPIYAQVAQSVAGSVGRFAGKWLDPELTAGMTPFEAQVLVLPRIRGPVDGDTNAALAVGSTLALAIYEQRRSNTGQFVSTTMIGGNAWAYADDFVRYEGKPALPRPDDDNHGLHALYRLYPCASSWIFLAAPRQSEWDALVAAIGRPELDDDERFRTPELRGEHDDALTALLADVFSTKDAASWEDVLSAAGVGCAQAFAGSHSQFTCTDPVLRETYLVVEIEHPLFGKVLRHGLPVALSHTPGRLAPCCLNGEHTEKVLAELGYSAEQIEELKAGEVVYGMTPAS
jgi:crotonobetainyl-CoA:carnitine CoA-transferase CaiB-like acyl-CoA transferase